MPKPIYWMLVDSHQMPPETPGVLSPSELEKFRTFRFPKRQNEWLLGRWTAKALAHSLPAYRDYSLDQLEIQNSPEGAPYIQLPGGITLSDCLTISHSGHLALCALAIGPDLRVGGDLEQIEPRTEAFIQDYFTPSECQLVDTYPAEVKAVVVNLIWSAKESMLKALEVGLRWDTRQVEIHAIDGLIPNPTDHGGWQEMLVNDLQEENRQWSAWWQRRDGFILTLAFFTKVGVNPRTIELIETLLPHRVQPLPPG